MTTPISERPTIEGMSPFFIVSHIKRTIAFYCDKLGFQVCFQGEDEDDPYFAIVCRGGAKLLIKAGEAAPMPNPTRDPAMRWDAYLDVPDPDALAAEYTARSVTFSVPLKDTSDGLRGFELRDSDGYVLFFGCPIPFAAIYQTAGQSGSDARPGNSESGSSDPSH